MRILKKLYSKIIETKKPALPYEIAVIIIAAIGIMMSVISSGRLIKIIAILVKNKSYTGNEPYLAAVLITLSICIFVLVWGFKSIISICLEMNRYRPPESSKFKDYSEVEKALVQKKLQSYETASEYVIKKDKSFIGAFLYFLFFLILLFIIKMFLPEEFFWNLRLEPQHVSFPLLFTIILGTAAAVRWLSVRIHDSTGDREMDSTQVLKSIKTGADPASFIPGIEKALVPIRQDGKPNLVYRSGFGKEGDTVKDGGKIYQKLFVETRPSRLRYVRRPIMYLYLFFGIFLMGTGFFFMTGLPPDNISVLTVPAIALAYIWAIIKGGILVFSGADFLKSVSRICKTYRFKSVMVYVEINGVYKKAAPQGGPAKKGSPVHNRGLSDCDFNVFTASLRTEMNMSDGNRQIIKMTAEHDSENAKKMTAVAVESFMFDQRMKGNILLPVRRQHENG